jgi:RIO kinase 1
MIYRLRAAGVRVPVPHHFVDGVLIMELVTDGEGNPAPRLGDLSLDLQSARDVFDRVLAEAIRMLAAGVVHGDLSDFNVLMGPEGPVIIDFPQAVDASSNQNARKLLLRDVDNLHRFLAEYDPGRQPPPFAQEMWQLYERGELMPDTKLTGGYRAPEKQAGTADVLELIADAEHDERRRRESLGIRMRGGADRAGKAQANARPLAQPVRRQDPPSTPVRQPPQAQAQAHAAQTTAAPAKRKRRRRRRKPHAGFVRPGV